MATPRVPLPTSLGPLDLQTWVKHKEWGTIKNSWEKRYAVLYAEQGSLVLYKRDEKKDINSLGKEKFRLSLLEVTSVERSYAKGEDAAFVLVDKVTRQDRPTTIRLADEPVMISWMRRLATVCMLHAVRNNNEELALSFLSMGADVNAYAAQHPEMVAVLVEALRRGHQALCTQMFQHNAQLHVLLHPTVVDRLVRFDDIVAFFLNNHAPLDVVGSGELSLLHYACDKGKVDVVRSVLSQAPPMHANDEGDTPLHLAMKHGHADIGDLLMEAGADASGINHAGLSTLHLVLASEMDGEALEKTVRALLKAGAPVSTLDPRGCAPIHYCIERKLPKLANFMVFAGADVNVVSPTGKPLLHLAITNEFEDLAWTIMDNEAVDLNALDSEKNSALQLAIERRFEDLAQNLVENGANADYVTSGGEPMLHLAFNCECRKVLSVLVNSNLCNLSAHDRDGYTLLHRLVLLKEEELARFLVDGGANCEDVDPRGNPVIFVAVSQNMNELVRYLISKQKIEFLARNAAADTILHHLLKTNNDEMAQMVLQSGSDPNVVDADGNAPVHVVVLKQDANMLRFIAGVENVNMNLRNRDNGKTALFMAVETGQDAVARYLLDELKVDPNLTDKNGENALNLFLRGSRANAKEELSDDRIDNINKAVQSFLRAKADVRLASPMTNDTAMSLACKLDLDEVVELFTDAIGSGALPKQVLFARDSGGNTPVHVAVLRDNESMLEELVGAGAPVDEYDFRKDTPLHAAINGKRFGLALALVAKKPDLTLWDAKGSAPMHTALKVGATDVLKAMIAGGADCNLRTEAGETPLAVAVNLNQNALVEYLLTLPVHVNVQLPSNRWTPLHLAVQNHNVACVKMLLKHEHTKVNLSNSDGVTPLALAKQLQFDDLVQVLQGAGGRLVDMALPSSQPARGASAAAPVTLSVTESRPRRKSLSRATTTFGNKRGKSPATSPRGGSSSSPTTPQGGGGGSGGSANATAAAAAVQAMGVAKSSVAAMAANIETRLAEQQYDTSSDDDDESDSDAESDSSTEEEEDVEQLDVPAAMGSTSSQLSTSSRSARSAGGGGGSSGSAAAMEPARRWNDEFQALVSQYKACVLKGGEALARVAKQMIALYNEFVATCSKVAMRIVAELHLANEQRSLPEKQGRYLTQGVRFTVARDRKGFFGGDHNAMKMAAHDYKGHVALQLALLYEDNNVHFPLTTIVDFAGSRVTATAVCPVGRNTLVYGSADMGKTVHRDQPALNDIVATAGQRINIKAHLVGVASNVEMYGPCDMQGHLGKDGRFYLFNTRRLFPPEKLVPEVKNSHMFWLLRPELVLGNPAPLSSDAFSSLGKHNQAQHNEEVKEATARLTDIIVPQLSGALDTRAQSCSLLTSNYRITEDFHRYGVNMRYLALVAHYAVNVDVKQVCMVEMLARAVKDAMKKEMRSTSKDKREVVIKHLNFMLIDTNFPRIITAKIQRKFFRNRNGQLSLADHPLDLDTQLPDDWKNLTTVRLEDLVGFRLKYSVPQLLGMGRQLITDDVGDIVPRAQQYAFLCELEGRRLFDLMKLHYNRGRAPGADKRSEYRMAESLFAQSMEKYEQVLDTMPGRKSALQDMGVLCHFMGAIKMETEDFGEAYWLFDRAMERFVAHISLDPNAQDAREGLKRVSPLKGKARELGGW